MGSSKSKVSNVAEEAGAAGNKNTGSVIDKLTEAQLEQLMAGQLVPSGRWCQPTGVTLAGFEEPVDLTRELPEHLVDVLSRLVVLRARHKVKGPLEALIPRLPVDAIRTLDLEGCPRLTGGSSRDETWHLMLPHKATPERTFQIYSFFIPTQPLGLHQAQRYVGEVTK